MLGRTRGSGEGFGRRLVGIPAEGSSTGELDHWPVMTLGCQDTLGTVGREVNHSLRFRQSI